MTSFTGPTCSDGNNRKLDYIVQYRYYAVSYYTESVSYEFGPNRGIIIYTFPEDNRPEMQEDVVSLGFITTKSDAVLLRLVSGTSNDYIEMEIVSSLLFLPSRNFNILNLLIGKSC